MVKAVEQFLPIYWSFVFFFWELFIQFNSPFIDQKIWRFFVARALFE